MALAVQRAIDPSTPKSILKLGNDFCPFGLRAREMFVDIVDVDLHHHARRRAAVITEADRSATTFLLPEEY
jgi:hypothetical protein